MPREQAGRTGFRAHGLRRETIGRAHTECRQQNPHTDGTTTPRATFQQTIKDEHLHSIRFESRAFMHEKKAHFSEIFSGRYFANPEKATIFATQKGGLAQLARALAWHARGHEFESRILHQETTQKIANPCKSRIYRDFYFGRNAEKGIEKRVTCGLFGVLFSGPKKYTELLVTDWFAPICSGLPLDMRHLGN